MLVHFNGFQVSTTTPIQEIHQALSASRIDGPPHLLGYTAVARVNPFQSLLYRSFGDLGVASAPVLNGHDFRMLPAFSRLSSSVSVHFHWINWVIGNAKDRQSAASIARGFLGRVDRFRESGGKVAWTVHNVYPHDARFVEEELELQQGLADRADAVHLMAQSTVEAMEGMLSIDAQKTVMVPHPSYVGAYENFVSRQEARSVLGIAADEVVFVLFGALKTYKGLHETLDGFQAMRRRNVGDRYRLIVAGHPDTTEDVSKFVRRCLADPDVLIEPRRIPSGHAQYYLNAANIGLVPYTRSLNSGAALLYLSFGLSVLATDTPVLRETIPEGLGDYVQNPSEISPDEIADGLERAGARSAWLTRGDVLRGTAHLDSALVSRQLYEGLGAVLGWTSHGSA